MEQVNYAGLLPTQPTPEQIKYCFEQWHPEDFIIYRHTWYRDSLTDVKMEGAACHCTACGADTIWTKVHGNVCGRYSSAPFGVLLDGQAVIDGNNTTCPECGATVTMRHVSHINHYIEQCHHVMSVDRLGEKLVLLGWVMQREIWKDGTILTSIKPYEAYVIERRKVVRLTAFVKGLGFFKLTEKWEQRKRGVDGWGVIEAFLPWDPAILEGSTAENSKLDLYMSLEGDKRPVSYLRLWQRHPNVENLLVQNAGNLLRDEINSEMSSYNVYGSVGRGVPKLDLIDWKQRRPAQMLGLNKDEFRWFRYQQWSYAELGLYRKFRERVKPDPEKDIPMFRSGTIWSINKLIDEGYSVRRCCRYVEKQGKTVQYLLDYWNMAQGNGIDLSDESLRFPRDLERQHDRVLELRNERWERERANREEEWLRQKEKERKARVPKYAKAVAATAWTAFSAGGILIRPIRDEDELIAEGKALSHCVGTYAARIADGSTMILAIRREAEPDKPWFTLQLNPKTLEVEQNLGMKNCAPTKEVNAFVKLWTKTILKKESSAA